MKAKFTLWFLPLFIGWSRVGTAQNVNIPDVNFKNYLVSVSAINTNSDGEIQVSEAAAYTGGIYAGNKNISDMTGLEAFTNITTLDCSGNNLTLLDITYNTKLTTLGCNNNQLTGLDCTTNTSLQILTCGSNQLTGLNVLSNTLLTSLSCENNQLLNLNVANNTALVSLTCANNQLPSLFLDNNMALKYLNCQDNQITFLSMHAHTALREIRCYNNQLTTLNVKNGSNASFTAFFAYNNPGLTCITVDNVSWSNSNWSAGKDAGASFSTDCLNLSVSEWGNEGSYSIYPNPSAGTFMIHSNTTDKFTANIYDVNGKLAINKNINGNTEINANELNDGIYTLIIRSEDGISAKKVVIAR